jgi:hypothetical protein
VKERSPIIFWLLLAATLCLDAIAIVWILRGHGTEIQTFFMALTYAQLSTLCVWAVLVRTRSGFRWLLPFCAGLLAALVIITCIALSEPQIQRPISEGVLLFAAMFWSYVAILSVFLWALKSTRLLAGYVRGADYRPWRFATKHLLLLMTGVPILIMAFRSSSESYAAIPWIAAWTVGSTILTILLSSFVQTNWNWLLRLAASLGTATAIGVAGNWLVPLLPRLSVNLIHFFVIQAVVTWPWLEVLYTRAARDKSVAGDDPVV